MVASRAALRSKTSALAGTWAWLSFANCPARRHFPGASSEDAFPYIDTFAARADVDAREVLRALRRPKQTRKQSAECGTEASGTGRVSGLAAAVAQPTGHLRQLLLEELRLAQRRGHGPEPRLRKREQRHPPSHASRRSALPV